MKIRHVARFNQIEYRLHQAAHARQHIPENWQLQRIDSLKNQQAKVLRFVRVLLEVFISTS